jgi:hypothetical protein
VEHRGIQDRDECDCANRGSDTRYRDDVVHPVRLPNANPLVNFCVLDIDPRDRVQDFADLQIRAVRLSAATWFGDTTKHVNNDESTKGLFSFGIGFTY